MSIFHAYDVRGRYGTELDEAMAFNVAHAFVKFLRPKNVVIGHDTRLSAPSIHQAVMDGLVEAGCRVTSIGLCTTPMNYYAIAKHGFDGGIMVTASHNPKEDIGLKLSGKNAVPIGGDSGMDKIEVYAKSSVRVHAPPGKVHLMDMTIEYRHFLSGLLPGQIDDLTVAVDCGNAVGALDFEHLKALCGKNMMWHGLFTELDGNFPNHQPNPIDPKCVKDLIKTVKEKKAHIGIGFDGDSDRVGFVDENGVIVEADMILALVASHILKTHPKEHFLYDLRSSNIVRETIERLGGTLSMARVGHAFAKKQMAQENAILGGELAAHYYFRDTFYADNALLCAFYVLAILSTEKKRLSELIAPFRIYARSGEVNRRVKDADSVLKAIEKKFGPQGKVNHLDGIRVDCKEYWINVRKSNTEPVTRLIVEAKDKETMERIRDEALTVIGGVPF